MSKITILCPYHGMPEELEFTDSDGLQGYHYEGEVRCGEPRGEDFRAILNIEIIEGQVRRVELKKAPKFELRYFE